MFSVTSCGVPWRCSAKCARSVCSSAATRSCGVAPELCDRRAHALRLSCEMRVAGRELRGIAEHRLHRASRCSVAAGGCRRRRSSCATRSATISASGGVALPASSKIASANVIAVTSGLPDTPAHVPAITRAAARRSDGCALRADRGEVVLLDIEDASRDLVRLLVASADLGASMRCRKESARRTSADTTVRCCRSSNAHGSSGEPCRSCTARDPRDRQIGLRFVQAQEHVVDRLMRLRREQDLSVRVPGEVLADDLADRRRLPGPRRALDGEQLIRGECRRDDSLLPGIEIGVEELARAHASASA